MIAVLETINAQGKPEVFTQPVDKELTASAWFDILAEFEHEDYKILRMYTENELEGHLEPL